MKSYVYIIHEATQLHTQTLWYIEGFVRAGTWIGVGLSLSLSIRSPIKEVSDIAFNYTTLYITYQQYS